MELTKIQFEDGQKVSDAYVEINGVKQQEVEKIVKNLHFY